MYLRFSCYGFELFYKLKTGEKKTLTKHIDS